MNVTPEQDLQDRWVPASGAVQQAVELLNSHPAADVAVIPMYLPGKQLGVWLTGQEARTVMGVVFPAADSHTAHGPVPSYPDACNAAKVRARVALGGEPGTTAHAVIDRDGQATVFEGPPGCKNPEISTNTLT